MPFLSIADFDVEVLTNAAAEEEPTVIGSVAHSFSGRRLSTVRAELRNWRFTTGPLLQSELNALIQATRGGVYVTVGGDAIGEDVLCEVRVRDRPYLADGLGFLRQAQISLHEVKRRDALVLTSITIAPVAFELEEPL